MNPYRAESEIDLAGKTVVLRATFEGMVATEQKAGVSFYQLMLAFRLRTVTIQQQAAVIFGGLIGSGETLACHGYGSSKVFGIDDVGQLLMQSDLPRVQAKLFAYVVSALAPAPDPGTQEDEQKKKESLPAERGRKKRTRQAKK